MRIILIVILIDVFIFGTSLIFLGNEPKIIKKQNQEYHMDRYGYYWKVHD
ncbi:MAG: hypothetical protein ACI9RG_001013 [Sulfurimonas sp.]|jgi:hypothetical protein